MKRIFLTIGIFGLWCFASCSDWLDVQPNSQIRDTELFTSESGFKEALAGAYTILTSESLYAKEMLFGMFGVLGQEWTGTPGVYDDDQSYSYDASLPTTRINNIWSEMYSAISNVNHLLANIDDAKDLFQGVNYEVIKGEALALRAFIHFDLLRCFGASYRANPSQLAIPYVTEYTAQQTAQHTVYEVLTRVLDDLHAAHGYLKADPIYTGQQITQADDNGYLINRQLHLNYYAVEGLLARVYLYMEEYDLAREYAGSVINSGVFSWSTQDNMRFGIDYVGAPEHLFALDVVGLSTSAQNYLTQGGSAVFSVSNNDLQVYYESSAADYRYLYLFKSGTGVEAATRYLAKYDTPDPSVTVNNISYYTNKVPLIKLSEMYYILAECQNQRGESVLASLNAVRTARGTSPLTVAPANFRTTMTSEFRKEFIGEGQLFFYHKRLNNANIPGSDQNLVSLRAYIFPLPDAEYDAANRNSNR